MKPTQLIISYPNDIRLKIVLSLNFKELRSVNIVWMRNELIFLLEANFYQK